MVHQYKRLDRSIELAALAEQLKATDIGLEFLTGELWSSHDPSGIVFTVPTALSGMEHEYIRDHTPDGHKSARTRGTTIGGAAVTDDAIPSTKGNKRASTPHPPPSGACSANTTREPPRPQQATDRGTAPTTNPGRS